MAGVLAAGVGFAGIAAGVDAGVCPAGPVGRLEALPALPDAAGVVEDVVPGETVVVGLLTGGAEASSPPHAASAVRIDRNASLRMVSSTG
jgi:hypothetical protein